MRIRACNLVTFSVMPRVRVVFFVVFLNQLHVSLSQEPTERPPELEEITSISPTTTTTTTTPATTTPAAAAPLGVEIIHASVNAAEQNAIRLVWGCSADGNAAAVNYTYGVHYAVDEADLTYPKLTTTNASILVSDLEFCTKYLFGISVFEGDAPGRVNLNNVRSVITGADRLESPKDLQVEYEPNEQPCMLIRWSAPCENVVEPMGYLISVFEKNNSRYKVVTVPRSKRADIVYHLPVSYGGEYEATVSTATPGATASEPATLFVPEFLQPWRMRVAVDTADDAFLVYWAEPYIPPSLRYRYYYEVLVYKGVETRDEPERYYVTRPAIVYKSTPGAYTFRARLVSLDRRRKSPFTPALAATPSGDVREVPAEDPPDEDEAEEKGRRRFK